MPILLDPEGNESNALFNLPVAWTDASVLEIGSGDGRLTWRYADKVARVLAIELLNLGLDEFERRNKERFDLAILSWSL